MNENVINFISAVAMAKEMLNKGVISKKEYRKAETVLAKKYHINKSSLYRDNDLINKEVRAMNMIQK